MYMYIRRCFYEQHCISSKCFSSFKFLLNEANKRKITFCKISNFKKRAAVSIIWSLKQKLWGHLERSATSELTKRPIKNVWNVSWSWKLSSDHLKQGWPWTKAREMGDLKFWRRKIEWFGRISTNSKQFALYLEEVQSKKLQTKIS